MRSNAEFYFITPNTFIKGSYFTKLRTFLSTNVQLNEIIDFGNKLIFDDANVFCAITAFTKSNAHRNWVLKTDLEQEAGYIDFNQTEFILKNSLINKLDQYEKIEKFFDVKDVGFNYWTEGRGKVRGNSIGSRVLYKGNLLDSNDIAYIKGSDIKKFKIGFSGNYLKHDWKSYLNEADTFRFSENIFKQPEKIVYRQTSDEIIAALDTCTRFNDKTVHIIIKKEYSFGQKYLLALLNSKLFNYYFKWHKQEEGKTFAQVKTIDIKALPFVYKVDTNLVSLVEEALLADDTSELLKKINNTVYNIFELTPEDIALVESSN